MTLGLDTDLLFASSTDDALTWSDAAAVDLAHSVSDSESEGNPTLCWAGGLFLVVFMYGEGDPPIRYAYSASPDGLTWSPFAETGLRTYWDDVTMLAGDGRGNWALAWRYDRNVIAAAPLEVARVGDSLHFESGQRSVLFESPDHEAFSPAICTDAMGHWVARWATRPTSVLSLSEGMPVAAPSIAGPSGDLDETFSLQSSAATGTPVTSVLFWRGLE